MCVCVCWGCQQFRVELDWIRSQYSQSSFDYSLSFFRDFFLCCRDIFPCQGASPFAIIEKKANTHRSKWQMQLIEENQLGLTGSIQTAYKTRTKLKKFYTKNCIEWGNFTKCAHNGADNWLLFLFFRNAVCRQSWHPNSTSLQFDQTGAILNLND